MSKSDYLENKLLAHELAHENFTPPTHHYFALFTSAPNDAGGGAEVSGNGYQRKAMVLDDTLWTTPAGGEAANAVALQFVEPTGLGWGTPTHFGIFDAASGGNLLRFGPITTPKVIGPGSIAYFPPGSLVISED